MDNSEITNLARSIDLIARRCPRGLSALAGDVPQPSYDELVAAATWTPAAEVSTPGGSSGGSTSARLSRRSSHSRIRSTRWAGRGSWQPLRRLKTCILCSGPYTVCTSYTSVRGISGADAAGTLRQ